MKENKVHSTASSNVKYVLNKHSIFFCFSAQSHLVVEKGEIFDYRQIEGNAADTNILFWIRVSCLP